MIDLDIRVTDPAWTEALPTLEDICLRAANAGFSVNAPSRQKPDINFEVSVLLTTNDDIQILNRDWRGKDKPTDVLSFPADAIDWPFLGDIALGYGVMLNDADEKSIGLEQHLSHLIIHAYLHLLGHDHKEDTQAEHMEKLEITALASLGWPDPYS